MPQPTTKNALPFLERPYRKSKPSQSWVVLIIIKQSKKLFWLGEYLLES